MLRLKLATEKRWAELAEKNLKEAMIDHAFCEQKAASSAISIIVNFPDYPELVKKMSEIAIEEMEHFRAVHDKILARGWKLKLGRKNDYVNKISKFFPKTSDRKLNLINKLLLAAMIEARSCERFRVLTLTIKDKELVEFYHELTKSEAGHFALFLNFAKKYADGIDIEAKWQEFLKFEAEIVQDYGKSAHIHA